MKLICERDALDRILKFVRARPNASTKLIPILQNVRIDVTGGTLAVTATYLTTRSEATCAAEVSTQGATTVGAERLSGLIGGLPQGAQVSMELREGDLHLICGRSRYKLPTLPVEDFPTISEPSEPIEFSLPCLDVRALFGETTPAITLNNGGRIMLEGGCLYQPRPGEIAVVGADGPRVIRRTLPTSLSFTGRFIIPKAAMAEIVKMAGEGEINFRCGTNLLEARAGNRVFMTKLIEATYPDVERLIPKLNAKYLLVDRKEFAGALHRLTGLMEDFSQIDITWLEGAAALKMSLTGAGSGVEEVAAECDLPSGRITFAPVLLGQMVDAIKSDTLQLHITSPTAGMRLADPNDEGLTVLAFPLNPRSQPAEAA